MAGRKDKKVGVPLCSVALQIVKGDKCGSQIVYDMTTEKSKEKEGFEPFQS